MIIVVVHLLLSNQSIDRPQTGENTSSITQQWRHAIGRSAGDRRSLSSLVVVVLLAALVVCVGERGVSLRGLCVVHFHRPSVALCVCVC